MASRFTTRKPYPSFPLTPRADGRFCKRIRGVVYYYGGGGDWKGALDEYLASAHARHSGRAPGVVKASAVVTVKHIRNRYLMEREREVEAGTLSAGSWDDYRANTRLFLRHVGGDTPASQLGPDHFTAFAAKLRKGLGSYAFNRARANVLAWLRYAAAAGWIDAVQVGVAFRKVPAGKMRGEKKVKLFTPAMIRGLLRCSGPQMRAMILLGINGGFGSTDCAHLTRDAIDFETGVIRYRRRKTNIARTVPLWEETADALRVVLAKRPDDPYVFRTVHGNLWSRVEKQGQRITTKDSVADRFGLLLRRLWMKSPGLGFYALRHTFATYANEVRDSDARLHLMGRRLPGLDDQYIERFFLPRLRVVVDHVRARVLSRNPALPQTPPGSPPAAPASSAPAVHP